MNDSIWEEQVLLVCRIASRLSHVRADSTASMQFSDLCCGTSRVLRRLRNIAFVGLILSLCLIISILQVIRYNILFAAKTLN